LALPQPQPVAGLGAFAFLAWFAVRLADRGAELEAVGVIGFGLPMVVLFVTGQVMSRRSDERCLAAVERRRAQQR